jgi:hypothetical protein
VNGRKVTAVGGFHQSGASLFVEIRATGLDGLSDHAANFVQVLVDHYSTHYCSTI